MQFFKERETIGLETSLKLLDLPSDASIDDANRAYAALHRMIERFHRDNASGAPFRQEDMDLLTCAYEKAVSYLSDPDAPASDAAPPVSAGLKSGEGASVANLHFKIDFSGQPDEKYRPADAGPLPEPDGKTVETAVSIISRRLREAESALETTHQSVEAATAEVERTSRQLQRARQAGIDAAVEARSAKTRALLMEIEANRAMEEAKAIAEKARARAEAVRQNARQASTEADEAKHRVHRIDQARETAVAAVVCAEDRLEMARERLKVLTHKVVEARERLRLFKGHEPASVPADGRLPATIVDDRFAASQAADLQPDSRRRIMGDLLEIESSLSARKPRITAHAETDRVTDDAGAPDVERRRHVRLAYPDQWRPMFCMDGRSIPVLDLSTTGMGLAPDAVVARSRLVRGSIAFAGRAPVRVTGRVVREDERGLGLRLVTRLGNHLLDQERVSLGA